MVRKLRKSLSQETRAYFYLSPVLNSKTHKRTENRCLKLTNKENNKEKQQKN